MRVIKKEHTVVLLGAVVGLVLVYMVHLDWGGHGTTSWLSSNQLHPTPTGKAWTQLNGPKGTTEWRGTTVNISQCGPAERATILQQECSRHNTFNLTKRFRHHYLYVSDEHRYVACLPLKAGCTTWKVILVNNTLSKPLPSDFNGKLLHSGIEEYNIYRLDSYSQEDQKRILKSYYKFMVVRHPLDRLLSGHNDKIVQGHFMHIRKQVMALRQKTHNDSSYDLTAFLELILKQGLTMDRHWYPATGLCDPCNVNYHKIVRLETQASDLHDVLPHLGPYRRSKDVHHNHKGTGAAKGASAQFVWRRGEFEKVDEAVLAKVMRLGYDIDMKLFGYSYNDKHSLQMPGFELTCQYPNTSCC